MDKIKKVFSPGKAQDDAVMYGTPSKEEASTAGSTQASPSSTLETNPEAEQKDKGVLRQVFNPSGHKYSEQSYGTTATAQPGMADQLQKEPASSEPLKGPETAQFNDDRVQQVGSGTTTMGPSTMAREDKYDDVSGATFTARSYALGSGNSADPQQTSSNVDQATRATTDLGPTGDELPRENAGRRLDHSLAGAGTGGAGAGYVGADELNEFMKHGRDPEADQATYAAREHYVGSSSDADPFQRPGHELYSADKGPAGVETAGEMAPGHVPGEFPLEDGGDTHAGSSGIGSGAATAAGLGAGAGAGAAGIAASRAYNDHNTTSPSRSAGGIGPSAEQPGSPIQTTTNTMRSGSFSKPNETTTSERTAEPKENSGGFRGALAAATAAMGLGGAGAYAASRDDKNDPASSTGEIAPSSQVTRSAAPGNVAPGSVVSDQTQSYTQRRPGAESTQATSTPATASQTQQPDRDDHTARNAALGAGAVGATGAGAYALSNRNRNEPQSIVSDTTQGYAGSHPSDSFSTQPTSTSITTGAPQSSQAGQDDHTARNAALGAGSNAGVGAGASALASSSNPSNTNTENVPSVVSDKTQAYHRSRPGDNNPDLHFGPTSGMSSQPATSSQAPTTSQTQRPEEDHTARNAALGAGAAGAAGVGAYGLSNRSNNDTGNAQSVVSPETQKYAGTHPSDTSSSSHGSGPTSSQTQSSGLSQQPREDDHTARNAALGTGAAGATGAGAYGLANRDSNNIGNAQSVVSPETQKYSGIHPSDNNPGFQSSSISAPLGQTQPSGYSQRSREGDHTARNAALGAGAVGAAGAGGYALSRDDDKTGNAQSVVSPETQRYAGSHPTDSSTTNTTTTTTTTSRSTDPVSSSGPTATSNYTRSAAQPSQEDHTARNAALGAGGVGAAGAGAYALSQNDDKTSNAQSVLSPDTQRYAGSHPQPANTTSPMSQTPMSSQPGGSTTNYSRPSDRMDDSAMESSVLGAGSAQPQSEDHTARNAALGAGGVGAAGAGAYALGRGGDDTGPASKTIGPHDSNAANVMDPRVRPEPTQQFEKTTAGPYQSNVANRIDPRVTSDPAIAQEQEQGHNYGRDAGMVAAGGAAGAAGYGAYEYANRGDPSQQYSQPQQVQQRAPAQETYTGSKPEKVKESTHRHKEPKHEKEPKYDEHDPRVAAGSDGHNKLHKKAVDPAEEDHTGRNAAPGAGGVAGAGAAGYGAKEYYDSKHDSQATTESQEGEKKHGLLHKILHPREHKREKEEEEARRSTDARRSYEQPPSSTGTGAGNNPNVVTGVSGSELLYGGEPKPPGTTSQTRDGSVTEPHTGLPMNVGKYGTGHGGTDGTPQIEGYHQPLSEGGSGMPGTTGATSSSVPGTGAGETRGGNVTEPHTGLPMNVSK